MLTDATSTYHEDFVMFNARRVVQPESPDMLAIMQDGGRTISGGRGKPGLTRIKALGRLHPHAPLHLRCTYAV